jgi:hypothetical protein
MSADPQSFFSNSEGFADELVIRINHADDTFAGKHTAFKFSVKSNLGNFLSYQTCDLGDLAKIFRSKFSRATVSSDGIASSKDGFGFCLLCQVLPTSSANESAVSCLVKARLEGTRVREVDLRVDLYSLLVAEGRICLDPGVINTASQRINRAAGASLVKAIATGTSFDDRCQKGLWLHGRVEVYKDISKNVDTRVIDINGHGRMWELLKSVATEFKFPQVEMIKEISHDRTTTFKGRIQAGQKSLRYDLFIGLRSGENFVEECWFRIAPPLTLLECVT